MKPVKMKLPVILIAIVVTITESPLGALSQEDADRVDATVNQKGTQLAERDSLAAAAAQFRAALEINPKHAPVLRRAGQCLPESR